MSESRQQRRARERAAAKAASGLGPRSGPAPAAAAVPRVLEVELNRYVMDGNDSDDVSWTATWGLRGGDVGVEDNGEDLRDLVDAVLADVRAWPGGDLRIKWTIGGDAPRGQTVEDVIAAMNITLPSTCAT